MVAQSGDARKPGDRPETVVLTRGGRACSSCHPGWDRPARAHVLRLDFPLPGDSLMNVPQTSRPVAISASRTAAFAALLLGTSLVFIAGFAPVEVVHNTAHDSRHSAGFPCH